MRDNIIHTHIYIYIYYLTYYKPCHILNLHTFVKKFQVFRSIESYSAVSSNVDYESIVEVTVRYTRPYPAPNKKPPSGHGQHQFCYVNLVSSS